MVDKINPFAITQFLNSPIVFSNYTCNQRFTCFLFYFLSVYCFLKPMLTNLPSIQQRIYFLGWPVETSKFSIAKGTFWILTIIFVFKHFVLSALNKLTSPLSQGDSSGSLVMRYVFETGSTTHSRPRLTAAWNASSGDWVLIVNMSKLTNCLNSWVVWKFWKNHRC